VLLQSLVILGHRVDVRQVSSEIGAGDAGQQTMECCGRAEPRQTREPPVLPFESLPIAASRLAGHVVAALLHRIVPGVRVPIARHGKRPPFRVAAVKGTHHLGQRLVPRPVVALSLQDRQLQRLGQRRRADDVGAAAHGHEHRYQLWLARCHWKELLVTDTLDLSGTTPTGVPAHVFSAGIDQSLSARVSLRLGVEAYSDYFVTQDNTLKGGAYQLVNLGVT
jgi:hypothetical protein